MSAEDQLGLVSTRPLLPEDPRHKNYLLESAFSSLLNILSLTLHLDPSDLPHKLCSVFARILRRHGLSNLQVCYRAGVGARRAAGPAEHVAE